MADAGSGSQFCLSAKGFANIVPGSEQDDFAFEVGDRVYHSRPWVAEFLSPRVSALRRADPTMNSIRLTTEDPNGFFDLLLWLGRGSGISFTTENQTVLLQFTIELLNGELSRMVKNGDRSDSITAAEALVLLRSGCDLGNCVGSPISFLSSHFSRLPASIVGLLDYGELEAVLSDESLVIESEEWLFGFILSRLKSDERYLFV
jgi:hypothetical protein